MSIFRQLGLKSFQSCSNVETYAHAKQQQQQQQQQAQQQHNQLFFGGQRHMMDKSLELEQMKNPADAMFAAMDSGFRYYYF